jgi:hypothetical protein
MGVSRGCGIEIGNRGRSRRKHSSCRIGDRVGIFAPEIAYKAGYVPAFGHELQGGRSRGPSLKQVCCIVMCRNEKRCEVDAVCQIGHLDSQLGGRKRRSEDY